MKPLITVTQVRNPDLHWEARLNDPSLKEVGIGQDYEKAIDDLLGKLKKLNRSHEKNAYDIKIQHS